MLSDRRPLGAMALATRGPPINMCMLSMCSRSGRQTLGYSQCADPGQTGDCCGAALGCLAMVPVIMRQRTRYRLQASLHTAWPQAMAIAGARCPLSAGPAEARVLLRPLSSPIQYVQAQHAPPKTEALLPSRFFVGGVGRQGVQVWVSGLSHLAREAWGSGGQRGARTRWPERIGVRSRPRRGAHSCRVKWRGMQGSGAVGGARTSVTNAWAWPAAAWCVHVRVECEQNRDTGEHGAAFPWLSQTSSRLRSPFS